MKDGHRQLETPVANLYVSYYYFNKFNGFLPTNGFVGMLPFKTEYVPSINFPKTDSTFAGSGLSDDVAAVFKGYLQFPFAGDYAFCLTSNDGSKLFIDDELIIDNDGVHSEVTKCSNFTSASSPPPFSYARIPALGSSYKVEVQYFERSGYSTLLLSWKVPHSTSSIAIPPGAWKPIPSLIEPTITPTSYPRTGSPTELPTREPTKDPTNDPTKIESSKTPSSSSSKFPSDFPTISRRTPVPSTSPSNMPSNRTGFPTGSPTNPPTNSSTNSSTNSMTGSPTGSPTITIIVPSVHPTHKPTELSVYSISSDEKYFEIISTFPSSGPHSFCIQPESVYDKSDLIIKKCDGSSIQKWSVDEFGRLMLSSKMYLCITVQPPFNTLMIHYCGTSSPGKNMFINNLFDSTIVLKGSTSMVFTIASLNPSDGDAVILVQRDRSLHVQEWYLK